LIDFNISQIVKDDTFTMFTYAGTEKFMAPEMLQNQKFNEKIDVWGAGCILSFLLMKKMPDNGSKGGFDSP
jgi:serine/threonine protein kinase